MPSTKRQRSRPGVAARKQKQHKKQLQVQISFSKVPLCPINKSRIRPVQAMLARGMRIQSQTIPGAMPSLYDSMGAGYSAGRRADLRIAGMSGFAQAPRANDEDGLAPLRPTSQGVRGSPVMQH